MKKYKFKEGDKVFRIDILSKPRGKFSSEHNLLELVTPQSVSESDLPEIGEEMHTLGESSGTTLVQRTIQYRSFKISAFLLIAPNDHPLVEFYRIILSNPLDYYGDVPKELEDHWVNALVELEQTILDKLARPFMVNAID